MNAIERARAFLGTTLAAECDWTASLRPLDVNVLPSKLVKQGDGVWYARAKGAMISGLRDKHEELEARDVLVIVRPSTGQILAAVFDNPKATSAPTPDPSLDSLKRQLAASGERWLGVSSDPPARDLRAALMTIAEDMGGTDEAARIVVHPLWWACSGEKSPFRSPRDVWSIDLRGTTPPPPDRPEWPIEARNHIRHIVDAATNKWLMATSVPQPDPPAPAKPAKPAANSPAPEAASPSGTPSPAGPSPAPSSTPTQTPTNPSPGGPKPVNNPPR